MDVHIKRKITLCVKIGIHFTKCSPYDVIFLFIHQAVNLLSTSQRRWPISVNERSYSDMNVDILFIKRTILLKGWMRHNYTIR